MSFSGGNSRYTLEYLIKVSNQGGASGFNQVNTGLRQVDSGMKQVSASAAQMETAHQKVIQAGQGVSKAAKGMAFGFIGMTTAGAEMVGMLSMWGQVQEAVTEAQEKQSAALAEGGKESKEYRDATQELAKANRWASMTFRNLMLSIFDMIPFIVLSINGILKMRTALASLREAKAAQAALQGLGTAAGATTTSIVGTNTAMASSAVASNTMTAANQRAAVSSIQSAGAFKNTSIALGTATTATNVQTVATTRLGTAMNILWKRILPLVAIIGTIAIAVKAWKENWGGVGDVVNEVGVAIGNIHPILKTTMEIIAKVGESFDALLSMDFDRLKAIWSGKKEGDIAEEFMFTEEQEKKIEEGQELMLDFRDAAVDSIVEISKAKKGEKNDWMKLVGIKGDEKDKMRDLLDTIEDSVGEMEQAGAKLHALEAFNLFEKFGFEIPDGVKQDVINTLDSDLRDILPGEDKFDELADIVQQNADKSWPEQRAAIASFFATNDPELLNMIKLVSPEMGEAIGALIGNMQKKFIELSEAQKAATAAGGVGTEAGADAWWDIMLPEADPAEIQKAAEAKKYGENITKGAIDGIIAGLKNVNINEVIGKFNDTIFIPLIENIQINAVKIGTFIINTISGAIQGTIDERVKTGKIKLTFEDFIDFTAKDIKSQRPKEGYLWERQNSFTNAVSVLVANIKIQFKKGQIAINNYIIANPWLGKLLKGDVLGSITEMAKALHGNTSKVVDNEEMMTIQDLGAELHKMFIVPIQNGINETWAKAKEFVNNNPWLSMLLKGQIVETLKSIIDLIGGGKAQSRFEGKMSPSDAINARKGNTILSFIQTNLIDPVNQGIQTAKTWWDNLKKNPISLIFAKLGAGIIDKVEALKQLLSGGFLPTVDAYKGAKITDVVTTDENFAPETSVNPPFQKFTPKDTMQTSQEQVDAFNMVHEASVRLQQQLANLSNEGSMSVNLLAVNSSTAANGINSNLNVAYVSAGHLQTGLANLANQGSNSLSILAKASSKNANGIRNNLNKAYEASTHLQQALARLSNEGSRSLSRLASASSRAMNGMINNFQKAINKANQLKSALNSIPSGGSVAGAAHGMHRTLQEDTTIFAHKGERVDIGPEHGGQSIISTSGSGGSMEQNFTFRIDGNDIVNTMHLDKRVRSNIGRNRDRFL